MAKRHEILRARSKPSVRTRRRLRERVLERDDYTCWICGRKVDPSVSPKAKTYPTLDHIIPWSEGGKWTMENLRTAHRGCNNDRHNPPRRRRGMRLATDGPTSTEWLRPASPRLEDTDA